MLHAFKLDSLTMIDFTIPKKPLPGRLSSTKSDTAMSRDTSPKFMGRAWEIISNVSACFLL